jgi:hypothetical protein
MTLRKRTSDRRLQRGRASDCIKHAVEELHSGDKVVVCCRVSGHTQRLKKNLADQELNLRNRAVERGAMVVGVVRHVGSGTDPYWLARAVVLAKETGAKLFAESTDRFVRHPGYHSNEGPDWQARETDLEDLEFWADGVTLVTDLHPDALPEEVRFYQQNRGQVAKQNKGGRPPKGDRPAKREWKKRRLAWINQARDMRWEGLSLRSIADRLNAMGDGFPPVTAKTVWNWLRRPE